MDRVIIGLRPIVDHRTKILILGSMPSEESLRKKEYYANARNRFWPTMESLLSISRKAPYLDRARQLNNAGVGLWDVIESCERKGSLDAGIVKATEKHNDLVGLLRLHSGISTIFCNGTKAYNTFIKRVIKDLDTDISSRLSFFKLPSTSPANASYTIDEIRAAWSIILEYISIDK